jgi:hypothetical protein
MKNVSDKTCRGNQNTHSRTYFRISCFCEVMWNHNVQPNRPQMIIWSIRVACWIPRATILDSEYVTLISFPLQQWLHERVSLLRYTYIACLVSSSNLHIFTTLRAYFLRICPYLLGVRNFIVTLGLFQCPNIR